MRHAPLGSVRERRGGASSTSGAGASWLVAQFPAPLGTGACWRAGLEGVGEPHVRHAPLGSVRERRGGASSTSGAGASWLVA
ncbi:hypothetical protein, partial [Streptomyces sp. NPDC008137]|uniref:hypothetical protein n=1 Tax=Streptomyces sp. NPDC008137 TaxID=3364813 RepID=UPI0036E51EB0